MKRFIPTLAAVTFGLLFISIIVIADRGEGAKWWPFIERMPMGDKLGHVGLVGTLSLLCNLAFQPRNPAWLPRTVTMVTLALLVLLTLEEIAQAFIPSRTCDPLDWLADLAGLAAGQYVARISRRKSRT